MKPSSSLLSSPVAKNLASAAVAGAVTYLRPARVPRWARRGLMATNTAGTGTAMLVGQTPTGAGPTGAPAPLAGLLGGRANPVGGAAGTLAALTGGVGLLTSAAGLKVDAKVEQMLLRRGVRNPRLLMAVGTVALVFAIGLATEKAAKVAEQQAGRLQRRQSAGQVESSASEDA